MIFFILLQVVTRLGSFFFFFLIADVGGIEEISGRMSCKSALGKGYLLFYVLSFIKFDS